MAYLNQISVSPETYARVKAEAARRGLNVRQLMDTILAGEPTMPAKLADDRLHWNRVSLPPRLYAALEERGRVNGTSAAHEARVILQAVVEASCSS